MRRTRFGLRFATALAVLATNLVAQQTPQPATRLPEFEAASVKPVDMNGEILNAFIIRPGGRLDFKGQELDGLIRLAFHPERITGGAEWTRVEKFDIQAVPPEDLRGSITDLRTRPFIADPNIRQMLQALLIRRFKLRFHYESVATDVYLLQKGADDPTFRPTSVDPVKANSPGWSPIGRDAGNWVLRGATMAALADALSSFLRAPVLDETGLTGAYDYRQRGTDEAITPGQDLGPSFLAFFKEMKLTLQKTKRPIDVFVIDSAERPIPD